MKRATPTVTKKSDLHLQKESLRQIGVSQVQPDENDKEPEVVRRPRPTQACPEEFN